MNSYVGYRVKLSLHNNYNLTGTISFVDNDEIILKKSKFNYF